MLARNTLTARLTRACGRTGHAFALRGAHLLAVPERQDKFEYETFTRIARVISPMPPVRHELFDHHPELAITT